ncbi:MAG: 3-phosphoshikimate 1-carboxyvinyltransferase [Planctomycetota bacterium]
MNTSIDPAHRFHGEVCVPGDKSIAHRGLILGALAHGEQVIEGLPDSEDVASTAACLRRLGASIEKRPDGSVRVKQGEWVQEQTLDAGNSGTTSRLLSGVIAGKGITCIIDGDASLRKRPMKRIVDPLQRMGAEIRAAVGICLPMEIRSRGLRGIVFEPEAASAQVKSAVLLAGLFASGSTTVIEKKPTRDHTELMLSAMGVEVRRSGLSITVTGHASLNSVHVVVPGDLSSALFFMVAAQLIPGAEVRLPCVGINPTRTGALVALDRMGANIELENKQTRAGEPMADMVARSSGLKATEISGKLIPLLIDELPILAVAATQAEGRTVVRDARELRHKESDRIDAMVGNLSRMGADIEALDDGFVIQGPCRLKGCVVDSFNDHRIAMAMAVAGLTAEGRTVIQNSQAVCISYPGFFSDLKQLVG